MIFNMVGGGSGGDIDKSQIIVTAESGSTVTCTNGTDVRTASEDNGTWRFTGLDNGEWTVTATKGELSASKTVTIDRLTVLYIPIIYRLVPDFTYTGEYALVNDDDTELTDMGGNWKLRLLTSGTLTFTETYGWDGAADAFLVGGGGGGCNFNASKGGGAGGGSGYTKTDSLIATIGEPYEIIIGAGGGAPGSNDYTGDDGGQTSAFGFVAAGGKGGSQYKGGDGGSGGGSGGDKAYAGGYDGGDGASRSTEWPGGTGQGTTTREFGETGATLYAGGGAGSDSNGTMTAAGGEGGGGASGSAVSAGEVNTGGGGGGSSYTGGKGGGSGIVIIRNHREVTA